MRLWFFFYILGKKGVYYLYCYFGCKYSYYKFIAKYYLLTNCTYYKITNKKKSRRSYIANAVYGWLALRSFCFFSFFSCHCISAGGCRLPQAVARAQTDVELVCILASSIFVSSTLKNIVEISGCQCVESQTLSSVNSCTNKIHVYSLSVQLYTVQRRNLFKIYLRQNITFFQYCNFVNFYKKYYLMTNYCIQLNCIYYNIVINE